MLNYQRLPFGGTKEECGPRPLNLGGATAKDRLGHSVDHPRAAVPCGMAGTTCCPKETSHPGVDGIDRIYKCHVLSTSGGSHSYIFKCMMIYSFLLLCMLTPGQNWIYAGCWFATPWVCLTFLGLHRCICLTSQPKIASSCDLGVTSSDIAR
jgi:hypothetical protein